VLRRRSHPRRAVASGRQLVARLLTAATGLVVVVLLALAVLLEVVPRVTGGMSLTVLTGSMEPGIKHGDIVVTRGIDQAEAQSLAVGDIITFLPYPDDPTLVTHRIVSLSTGPTGTSFVTRGDNNNAVDPWGPVADYKVRGKVLYTVPKLGYAREWAGQSLRWVVPALAGLLFVYAAVTGIRSFRRPGDEPEPARRPAAGPSSPSTEPADSPSWGQDEQARGTEGAPDRILAQAGVASGGPPE